MDIFQIGVFLAKPVLPNSPGVDIDFIVFAAVAAVIILYTIVKWVRSYRQERFCSCCGTKTKIHWRTEKRAPSRKWFDLRFGRGTAIQVLPVARCPKCGFEIEL